MHVRDPNRCKEILRTSNSHAYLSHISFIALFVRCFGDVRNGLWNNYKIEFKSLFIVNRSLQHYSL